MHQLLKYFIIPSLFNKIPINEIIIDESTLKTRFCHFDPDASGEKSHNYNKNKRFLVASLLEMTALDPLWSELIDNN